MIGIPEIDEIVRARLKPSRYGHTKGTLALALELAALYGEDEDNVAAAALFHDIAKDSTKPDNNLRHGPEAADIVRDEYGVTNEDVLNAIRYHTTGRAGMSRLELIIFLADTLEPGRTYEGVERLRSLVYEDLHKGALEVLRELNIYLQKNDFEPAKDSIEAIEWLEREIYE
jgi:putative nucleotidyltransferase with HDIG domain